ncbi:MAG: hypothetical protein SFY67_08405 [Candidatus Melainabacteria bacterium]|nr:hypothetical protein [Candidatus Melainabacteria bacterium]
MFVIGLVCIGGGGILAKQSFEDAKNVFESLIFSMGIVMLGFLLCLWSIIGPPG